MKSIASVLSVEQMKIVSEAATHILETADPDDRRIIADYGRYVLSGSSVPAMKERKFIVALYRCLPLPVLADLDAMSALTLCAFENAVARTVYANRGQS